MYNRTHDTCISYPNTKLYMIHLTGTKRVFVLPSNTRYTDMFLSTHSSTLATS